MRSVSRLRLSPNEHGSTFSRCPAVAIDHSTLSLEWMESCVSLHQECTGHMTVNPAAFVMAVGPGFTCRPLQFQGPVSRTPVHLVSNPRFRSFTPTVASTTGTTNPQNHGKLQSTTVLHPAPQGSAIPITA